MRLAVALSLALLAAGAAEVALACAPPACHERSEGCCPPPADADCCLLAAPAETQAATAPAVAPAARCVPAAERQAALTGLSGWAGVRLSPVASPSPPSLPLRL